MATKALDILFEITSKIFIECLPVDRRVFPSPESSSLLLAQVGQQWRSVALSTRELWSSIALEFSLVDICYNSVARLFGGRNAAPAASDTCGLLCDLGLARAGDSAL
ncbi:hypothetical protein C8J57DRAFT_1512745 [Mycena rebaudengoi]|nr:hypothetical protein C8J57DRAFT_1512745 [Mycena rebaudengoi]